MGGKEDSRRPSDDHRRRSTAAASAAAAADAPSSGSSRDSKRKRYRRSPSPRSPSPQSGGGGGGGGGGEVLSLSIEETNKLRAKLGLKPLEVDPPSTANSGADGKKPASAAKQEFVHVPAKSLTQERATAKLQERTAVSRQRREMRERLLGRGLGDNEEEEMSAADWIQRSRTLEAERKLADQRAKELAALDAEFDVSRLVDADAQAQGPRYGSGSDLAGLRVEHSAKRFKEGQTTVLVLKDRGILDADGDDEAAGGETLVNVNMVDDERYEANVKIRSQVGSAWHSAQTEAGDNDSDEGDSVGGFRPPQGKSAASVLSKYDSVISGSDVRKRSFLLAGSQTGSASHQTGSGKLPVGVGSGSSAPLSLEQPEPRLATDFLTADEIREAGRFKRRKRKVAKSRVLKADDLLPLEDEDRPEDGEIADTGAAVVVSKPGLTDAEIIERTPAVADEALEDLQSLLEKARRAKQLTATATRRARPEYRVFAAVAGDEGAGEDFNARSGAIVLDTTSEFCRNLGGSTTTTAAAASTDVETAAGASAKMETDQAADMEEEGDVGADFSIYDRRGAGQRVGTWQLVTADAAGRPSTSASSRNEPGGAGNNDSDDMDAFESDAGGGAGILEEEPELRKGGVAAALQLARRKGYLEAGGSNSQASGVSQFAGMRARNVIREDVRYDDIDAKFAKRDRLGLGGGSGGVQDFKELRNYRPDVRLEYTDEMGREMNQKDAFDHLSHRFHGKGSGKKKTEKRLKKIKEDMLLKSMGSSDTPLGTAEKLHAKLERQGTAYVCLSGRGAAASLPSGVSKGN